MARRIIDLTQPLPRDGLDGAFNVLEYERPRSGHGVFHRVAMETTAGTHVVTSRRYLASGYSLAEAPVDRFFGEGVALRLPASNGAADITQMDLDDAAGDRVRRGDIAVLALAPNASGRPKLTVFASQWLWDKGIKMLVLDHRIAIGSSPSWNEERTVLTSLFANEIPVIRGATNTDELSDERFAVMALPMRIEGVEAWPVRVVALDPGEPPGEEPVPAPVAATEAPVAAPDAEVSESGAEEASAEPPTAPPEAEASGGDAPEKSADAPAAEATTTDSTASDDTDDEEAKPAGDQSAAAAVDAEPASSEATAPDAEGDTPVTGDGSDSTPAETDAKPADGVSDAESESSPRSGS
jgi:kynurenine formamidase